MHAFSYSLSKITLTCAKEARFDWEGPICHTPSGFIAEQEGTFIIHLTYDPVLWPSTHRGRIAQVPGEFFSTLVTPYHQNERQSCPNISEMWTVPLRVRNDPGFKDLERWRLWNARVRAKAVSSWTAGVPGADRWILTWLWSWLHISCFLFFF